MQATGAVAGYRPERTLRLWVELRRQFKRRRTIGVFLADGRAAADPHRRAAPGRRRRRAVRRNREINLVDVATASGLNFTLFVLFAASGFFLVVVFALFFGDTVASEAQWGSLRYTLATPVPRRRLLRQKWYAALVLSVGAFLTLVLVSVVAGGLFYGFSDVTTPVGLSIGQGAGLLRLAGMVGYLAVHLLVVGALAFWLSTITDAPLAAVGGAVFTMIVFAILEQVTQLGVDPQLLPVGLRDRLDRPAADAGRLREPVPRRHPVADLRRGAHRAGLPSTSPAATSPPDRGRAVLREARKSRWVE